MTRETRRCPVSYNKRDRYRVQFPVSFLLVLLLLTSSFCATAESFEFRIPAGPADVALNEYARITGIMMLFRYDDVSPRQTNAVFGEYEADEALRRLLTNTDLAASYSDRGNLIIRIERKLRGDPMTTDNNKNHPKKHGSLFSRALAMLGAAVSVLTVTDALAESEAPSARTNRVLEEIVVTAQKRSESLQDVPISIVALSGEAINDAAIPRMQEFSGLIPNFIVATDPIGDKINIRGIQSGNNAGFEQSVGTYVDGVYHGRGIQSRFSFLDMERVEVLRGPQGTLFGKNTAGGALNITTAKPTDEFNALISLLYNVDTEEIETLGHVSGTLSDTVRGRLAFVHRDVSEGYVTNQFYDHGAPDFTEWGVRGSLEWEVSDATLVRLRVEPGRWKNDEYAMDTINAGPLTALGLNNEVFDNRSSIGARSGNAAVDAVLDFGSGQKIDGDSNEVALTVEHGFDNGGILTGIVAYSVYDFVRFLDADFSPLPGLRFDDSEDFDQTSIELKYASELGGRIEYLIGGYYQQSNLKADGRLDVNVPIYDVLLDGSCARIGVPTNSQQFRACLLGQLVSGEPPVSRYAYLDQESDAWAIFGQITINVTDTFRLVGGLRQSFEEKTAIQGARPTEFGTSILENGDTSPVIIGNLLETQTHEYKLKVDEDSVTWSANAQLDINNDVMLYASATTGNKSGGFNSFALTADPTEAQYEPEDVLSYEIGAKSRLFDNLFELNAVAFYTEYTDLQTSVFTGSTSFIVQNAAEATSKGIELDARWLATDQLTVTAGFGLADFSFDDFPNAGCTVDQLIGFRNAVGVAAGNLLVGAVQTLSQCSGSSGTAGVPGENNNLKGESSAHAPRISGHVSFDYVRPVGDALDLNVNVTALYQDDKYVQDDLDPFAEQKAHTKIDAYVTLGATSGAWDVSLIGKNLTDKRTIAYMNDTPLIDTARQALPDAPRTFALRGRVRF